MAKIFRQGFHIITLTVLCSISRAQTPDAGPNVSIVSRPRPVDTGNGPSEVPQVHLRIDTSLVLVPAQVTSAVGTSVTNLKGDNFHVFEDGVEQKIAYFSKDDAPLSVGLVFDSSGSMSNKIRKAADAAHAFFRTANSEDEFFLVEFGERPKLSMPFTRDAEQVYKNLLNSRPFGRTSLIDAIHLALLQMKKATNSRKAIVVLSDGGDNRSRLTRHELKTALLESSVQMYAMGVFDAADLAKHTREEENGLRLLDELAEQTGGRLYSVGNFDELDAISTTIGNALRNEYILGYIPSNQSRDGKYRQIIVKLDGYWGTPNTSVSYRHGYHAPVQ